MWGVRTVRGNRNAKVRVVLTEQSIRSLLCRKLSNARGHLLTVKAGQLCNEAMRVDELSMTCRVMVRQYLLSVLRDAVIPDFSRKYRIVLSVDKARDILGCNED
jgi:hypothetical protein